MQERGGEVRKGRDENERKNRRERRDSALLCARHRSTGARATVGRVRMSLTTQGLPVMHEALG